MDTKRILVFGVGELQGSIIQRAKSRGLFVVGIDPCKDALCRKDCDVFEVIGGQDYEGTLSVAKRYNISAIVTAATDKPLVMMARVAQTLGLPFFSIETAQWSTDKYLMKQRFIEGGVPCAKGVLVKQRLTQSEILEITQSFKFPIIIKPRDNSGSRGVRICNSPESMQSLIDEALAFSHLESVLIEELIEGPEYSIESLHYDDKSEIIQFTEKRTTPYPFNVELGHKQPAILSEEQCQQINAIINRIGQALQFRNCPSHTELKISSKGIVVLETSPRLGGDYITSILTPLSTGINIEDQLLHIALGEPVELQTGKISKASGICFFHFPKGKVKHINPKLHQVDSWPGVIHIHFRLQEGDSVNVITSSLNRYGEFIVSGENRQEVDDLIDTYESRINQLITVEQ